MSVYGSHKHTLTGTRRVAREERGVVVPSTSKSKGARTLKKAREELEREGFIVDRVELTGKYTSSKDLFSEHCDGFDLLALNAQGVIRMVQVKTNTRPAKKTYIEFAKKYATKSIQVWGYTWFDRKGWVKQKFNRSGTITEKDERSS